MIKVLLLLLGCFVVMYAIKRRHIHYARAMTQEEFDAYYNFIVYVSFPCGEYYCFKCTGSLLSDFRVLTAAHCFCFEGEQIPLDTIILVYFNTTVLGQGPYITGLLEKRGNFNCSLTDMELNTFQADRDVAIVRLNDPVIGVKKVHLACSPVPQQRTAVIIIGFGRDENGTEYHLRIRHTQRLRKCDLLNRFPQVKNIYCVPAIKERTGAILDTGDSGGPLLIRTLSKVIIIGVHNGELHMTNMRCNPMRTAETHHDLVSTWVNVSSLCRWFGTLPPEYPNN